jgi:adenylate cyclase
MARYFQFNTIKSKLILMILGIVIIIVLGLTSVIAYITATTLEGESKRQLIQSMEQSIFLLENFLETRENNLDIWGNSPLVDTIFRDHAFASVFVPSLREQFRKIKEKEPWLLHIFLLQEDQIIYDDSGTFSFFEGQAGFKSGIEQLKALPDFDVSIMNLSHLSKKDSSESLIIKRPFIQDGAPASGKFIILILDFSIINEKLLGGIKIGNQGFITLMAKSFKKELTILPLQKNSIEVRQFEEISSTWKDYQDIPESYQSILIHTRELNRFPIALAGVISQNDINEPVFHLLYLSSVFGLIAILFGIGSAIFYATKITRPIRDLTQKAKQLSKVDRTAMNNTLSTDSVFSKMETIMPEKYCHWEAGKRNQDELNILNDTFDAMANKLDTDTKKMLHLTSIFEKFVPYQFLNRVITKGWEEVALGKGERDFITILFSDIRSFTEYSEEMEPEELFAFLNEYLSLMNHEIHENHGFIDKFIGDAIMALFDHPEANDQVEAEMAIQAAIGMQETLKAFNQSREKSGHREIRTGIGIHSGQVMIGTIGSESRMDFTVLGDNVNLASRIESLTKMFGVDILISETTLRLLNNIENFKIREIDWLMVKGKSKPVGLYEVYNHDTPEVQILKEKAGSSILRGLTQRRRKAWDKAIKAFEKALAIYPEDLAIKLHISRCKQLSQMDLPEDWDGSIILDKK